MRRECPFCSLRDDELVWKSDLVVAFRDRYPVNEGHTLVITRRHIATYFDASPWEQQEIWRAVGEIKQALDESHRPAGFNVGFNAGWAAGQTVDHLHVHVIPRFDGDVPDPTGGVRGVIPGKQSYLTAAGKRGSGREGPTSYLNDESTSVANDPFAALPRFVAGEEQPFAQSLRVAIAIADTIDLLAAFVQSSGLDLLRPDLAEALERGSRVRILTGDSLGITSADALRLLLAMDEENEACSVRFYRGAAEGVTFHPKAYLFAKGSHGIGYVGSSNLSRRGLTGSIEWNLRSVSVDSQLFRMLRDRFERLFWSPRAVRLTREVIRSCERIAPVPPRPEPRALTPSAHALQEEALAALRRARADGAKRGLVVMASGLGKTYLSAMDFRQLGGERVLFVAHREEILDQARRSWELFFPERLAGLLKGATKDFDADLVFASVQTLSRPENLYRFGPTDFDYVVVDEFHHAAAATYRRLIGYFRPNFLLGLTATPDRMDGASLLALCDDRLVFRAGLFEGIGRRLLVPFHYFGVRDNVDYMGPVVGDFETRRSDRIRCGAGSREPNGPRASPLPRGSRTKLLDDRPPQFGLSLSWAPATEHLPTRTSSCCVGSGSAWGVGLRLFTIPIRHLIPMPSSRWIGLFRE